MQQSLHWGPVRMTALSEHCEGVRADLLSEKVTKRKASCTTPHDLQICCRRRVFSSLYAAARMTIAKDTRTFTHQLPLSPTMSMSVHVLHRRASSA